MSLLVTWLEGIAAPVTDTEDAREIADLVALLADAGDAGMYLDLCRVIGEALPLPDPFEVDGAVDLPTGTTAAQDAAARLGRIIMLSAMLARAPYVERDRAVDGRSAFGALADGDYGVIGQTLGADSLRLAVEITGQTLDALSQTIITLAPVIVVTTPRPLPASLVAWKLYGAPERGRELVRRNCASTPLVMPLRLQALSR